jgi:hypothetical protein
MLSICCDFFFGWNIDVFGGDCTNHRSVAIMFLVHDIVLSAVNKYKLQGAAEFDIQYIIMLRNGWTNK